MRKRFYIWLILKLNPPNKDGKPTCKKGTFRYKIFRFAYLRLLKLEPRFWAVQEVR